ncbi:hypothetical protein KSZ_49780 [Dictyobacter formicarum]|uniref:Uncharacterized protein n=1 Tax=Dictyobacter formicarum TaxID=2778368 RepID=A0ABQ3VL78_9CHLR|nr:hypothetical protein KSZ_49780 [Dictyobacter formicarum]
MPSVAGWYYERIVSPYRVFRHAGFDMSEYTAYRVCSYAILKSTARRKQSVLGMNHER